MATRPKALVQALLLQEALIEVAALVRSGDKEALPRSQALAQISRAWADVQEKVRIIRGKPAPKPVEVRNPFIRSRRKTLSGDGLDQSQLPSVSTG